MATKQVIVMRKDLKMRRGKEMAQASHASMAFLTKKGTFDSLDCLYNEAFINTSMSNLKEAKEWMQNSFTKICVGVNSEEELDEIYNKAKEADLTVHMIVDSGRTEFNNVPTKTCLAIGPHYSEKIDAITANLKLL